MLAYVIKRLLTAVLVVIVVGVVTQVAIHLVPGDPVFLILSVDSHADPTQVEAIREKLGLNRPLYQQVFEGVSGFFMGDLGHSIRDRRPISQMLISRFPVSMYLVVGSLLVTIVVGLPAGVIAAVSRGSYWDWIMRVMATIGMSTPVFVSGSLLIYLLIVRLGWIPAMGYVKPSRDFLGFLQQLALPAVTSGIYAGGLIARMTRSSILEILDDDYIRTAWSKGLSSRTVFVKHALRNALIPVVTLLGLQMGATFGNTVLVETVFNWPGIMSAIVAAARFHDFPVVRSLVMVIASILVLTNLVTDLIYASLDPRIVYR